MTNSAGVFGTLPQLFFSPLASPNREHYAAFLVMYYRIFQESSHGVERSVLVSRYTEYIALRRGQFSAEEELEDGENGAGPSKARVFPAQPRYGTIPDRFPASKACSPGSSPPDAASSRRSSGIDPDEVPRNAGAKKTVTLMKKGIFHQSDR